MWTFNDQSIVKKNHMDILWHKYADKSEEKTIVDADLPAKASVVGRVGLMMLSCGTGAWRVRSSMNELSALLDMTCTVDIGLMSIDCTCFDGNDAFSQSLCLTNTGVNTSKLNRLEKFVMHFKEREITKSCEEIHTILDKIEEIHGLYSPVTLAVAAALACACFTFLLGGGPIEMLCAFAGALYAVFVHYCVNISSMSFLFCYAEITGDLLCCKSGARGRIYLCHAFYHTGIPFYYQWD